MPRIERAQLVHRPVDEVFGFFADAYNLEAITPPYLRFGIVTPAPIALRAGAIIDYRLQLFGVPFLWKTCIESFEPQRFFVDRQIRGPYALWRHQHEFYSVEGGTLVVDRIAYAVGWSILGQIAQAAFVRRTVEDIFDYRAQRISELLDPAARPRLGAAAGV